MGQGLLISIIMFAGLRMFLAAAGDDMSKRGKRKNKFRKQQQEQNQNQNKGGFAALDATANKLEKKNKKKKHQEPARIPAPFESVIIPEPLDMPTWPGD